MSAALYLATGIALLWAADRWISPVRRSAALILLLIPLCLTGRAILTDGLFGPFDLPYETLPLSDQRGEHGFGSAHNSMISDLSMQIIPYRKAVRDAVSRGEWPLWNPYTLCGEPLAAEEQPAAYSPFTLLALLLPVAKSFTYTATLWFFIAALGAFLFARELGCDEVPALFAGVGFMACSALTFFILWPIGQAWALLPFVLLAVRRVRSLPWILLIALTLLLLTGHPESTLHVVFLGAAYGMLHLSKRAVLHAIAAGALALGICAIDLLPFIEATKQTEESITRSRFYAHEKRSVGAADSMVILATDLLADTQQRGWRTPRASELRSYTAAAGSIVLALFVYAMGRVRGREKWFFFGMLVFCLLEHVRSPLEDLLQRVPLFDIAVNDRFAFGAAFAFVILAALGVDRLARDRDVLRFAATGFAVILSIAVMSWVIERRGLILPNVERWGVYRTFADVALLAIAMLILIVRPRLVAPALFACLLIQRSVQEGGLYPTFPADAAYPPIPLFKSLEAPREPFRIVSEGITFLPATNAFYGLEDVRGYSAMTFRRYAAVYDLWCRRLPGFVNIVDDLPSGFLSVMNVRYALAHRLLPLPAGWREIARYRGTKLLENQDVLARAFVPAVVHLGSPAPLIEMALEPELRQNAWIDMNRAPAKRRNGPGSVHLTRARYGFDIVADMKGDGWVVVSESAWPGWRATVDGTRIRHQFADITFLGIYLTPGKHSIHLVYWPDSFVLGRAISGATLLAIAIYVIARRRRASRDTDPRSGRSAAPRTPELRTDAV